MKTIFLFLLLQTILVLLLRFFLNPPLTFMWLMTQLFLVLLLLSLFHLFLQILLSNFLLPLSQQSQCHLLLFLVILPLSEGLPGNIILLPTYNTTYALFLPLLLILIMSSNMLNLNLVLIPRQPLFQLDKMP